MSRIALIAGEGRLAPAIASALDDPLVYALDGLSPAVAAKPFRLERLVPFLDELLDQGATEVVFAGAIRRPRIEPELFDARTMAIVPRIVMGMQSGDDAALRAVIEVFEESGLKVLSVDEILPDLVPGEGVLAGEPGPRDHKDAARAAEIVRGLGPLDVGQGAVVAQGLCLAIEALPGTHMLFITARVPASTSVAPLFQQNWPRAVASTPIQISTDHCVVVVGSFSTLPNSSHAGSTISSAPRKK